MLFLRFKCHRWLGEGGNTGVATSAEIVPVMMLAGPIIRGGVRVCRLSDGYYGL